MRIIRALIIDDEPLAHKVIIQYAKELPWIEIVGQCHKASEAYAVLEREDIDLLFLDIQMPGMKGLDFLKTLQQKPHVILTTAYEEYALESYSLSVADYLLKPFRMDRFIQAVNKIRDKIPKEGSEDNDSTLFIKVDKRKVQVSYNDIYYLESFGNYVKVWKEKEFLLTPATLTSYEEILPDDFIRIHKSFIISKSKIDYIEGNQIIMKNGAKTLVGKNYRSVVKNIK